ncbi:MAG: glycosyltransferase family 4 protein [Planctomycetota bacterium]|jgi:glycosyltransferase involved in cell wall biosynthesis
MEKPHLLLTNKKRGWSGEAAMIAELAAGMAKRGWRVTLAANPRATIIDRVAGTGVEILKLTLLKDIPQVAWTLPADMRRVAQYVRDENVSLIHSHASFDTWTTALAIYRHRLGIPLIRTKHNVKRIRSNLTNRWYYGKAIDLLIAPSRAVREDLESSPIVPADKIHYIPYGIPIDKIEIFSGGKREARKALGLPETAEVAAYISRITRRKDPGTFVKACLEVAISHPELKVLVVGSGDDELLGEMQEMTAGNPAVEFWGHRDDVPRILAATDVFVLPSITEAFGLAPLEAMLQRVPAIVSDAEGFRDFVEHEKNGLVFPKGDVKALAGLIERVLSDADLRERLAEAGERTVREKFYVDRMVDDVKQLYDQVLAQ